MKRPFSSEVWYGRSAWSRAVRCALIPASFLYSAGWTFYAWLYRSGILKAKSPHRPVVCVGNLVVGGTGKTPLTLHVGDVLRSEGFEVVISCSGYGGPASAGATIAPEGELSPAEWGDEPAVIREAMPDCPLIVGRDRVYAAELCAERFPKAVLLMDDGFQHLPLRKHVSIVIEPETDNRFCLPAGPYREPRRRAVDADIVIPRDFELVRHETRFVDSDGRVLLASVLRRSPIAVLCAIGDPDRFIQGLKSSGFEIAHVHALKDHDKLDAGNLFSEWPKGLSTVVTVKDWVKLRHRLDADSLQFVIAVQDVELTPAEEFRRRLAAMLHETA